MDRLDEFLEFQAPRGPRCTYELLNLGAEDRSALDEALKSAKIASKSIERWLEKRGQRWRYFAIARHRRGECRCANV
jgi:hypothetical protein